MARKPVFLLGLFALILILGLALSASARAPAAPSLPPDPAQVRAALQGAPLLFIQNAGQFAPQARFQVRGGLGGGSLWLADDALWITLVKPVSPQPPAPTRGEGQPPAPSEGRGAGGEGLHLRLRFLGANPHPRLEPFQRLETHVSYFIGNDPAKWRADVPVWGGVRYVGLYPGVDLEVSGEGGAGAGGCWWGRGPT